MISTLSARLFALAFFCLLISSSLLHAQGGYALDFDGVDDFVDCGHVPFSSTMTYEAWIKTTDSKSRSDILSWGNTSTSDVVAEFRASLGKLEFGINDGGWVSLISNASINDGEWHHVAATKNASAITLYIDGVLDNTGTVGGSPSVNQTDIGVLHNGGTRESDSHFTGDLDEIRVWSDVRTQAEIQANMHKELVGNEANLVAYYQMSDGSGTSLTDNSTNSYTGTITNGPTWKTSGAHAGPGMVLDFDGTNDYVTGTISTSVGSTVTMEAWVNFNTLVGQQNFLRIDQVATPDTRMVLTKTVSNEVQLYINDGAIAYAPTSSSAISSANEWNHVAVVYNTGDVLMYVNGEEIFTTTSQGNFALSTSTHFSIGADYDGSSGGWYSNAKIDEVRIWDDVRTEAEIRAFKDRSLDGDEANLLAYYRFDQQPDAGHTTAHDYSSNGNDGTLTNMDATTDWVASAPFNTWVGSEDSDWSKADNWGSGTVPSSEDVGIFAWNDSSNAPASANISGRNLYVDAGASLSHSGDLTLSGDFHNRGTFTTSGEVTFSGTETQSIRGTGTSTFGTLTVNNASGVSMEQDLTTSTSLTLTNGAFSIGTNTLTINGLIAQTSGSLVGGSTSNLIIGGSGASTTLPAITLNDLALNRANGITLGGTLDLEGTLDLSDGVLDLNGNSLTFGNAASIGGSPSSASHIDATSATVRKDFISTGSFAFPTGDGTAYSPITLNFTAGTFSSGFATVGLTAAKHPNNISTTDYLTRYWTVSSSGITGFSCDVSAQYADADIAGTEANLTGAKYSGGTWTDLGAVSAGSNLITGTVSAFSDFTAGEATAFPVEMLSFEAQAKGGLVRLDWATANELNSDFFAVERSADLRTWSTLGQISAAGYSSSQQHYHFDDQQPVFGKAWYRLRQVDMDGTFDYSQTVEITLLAGGIAVYPNPVKDLIHLDLPGKTPVQATIIDLQGRVAIRHTLQPGNNSLSVAQLPAGLYLLRLNDGKGWTQDLPIVKE